MSSRPLAQSSRTIPALDGFRALAVGIVILYHSPIGAGIPGDLGVSAFFTLSGFLITWLLIQEYDRTGTMSLRAFYRRRLFRIAPAYYSYLLLSLVADTALHHPWSVGLFTSAVTGTMDYYNALLHDPINSASHLWSLGVEEKFYFLWPLAFLALWRGGLQRTQQTLLVMVGLILAWRTLLYCTHLLPVSYLYNAFDTRADNIAIGCLLAMCYTQSWFQSFQRQISGSAWWPLLTVLLLTTSRLWIGTAYHYTIGFTLNAVLFAILITQLIPLSVRHPAWRWLNAPAIRWLGALSYSCYLYHGWGTAIGIRLTHHSPSAWAFGVDYTAVIALAALSYYAIEQPALRYGRRSHPPAAT